jgi:hypothetical protein
VSQIPVDDVLAEEGVIQEPVDLVRAAQASRRGQTFLSQAATY